MLYKQECTKDEILAQVRVSVVDGSADKALVDLVGRGALPGVKTRGGGWDGQGRDEGDEDEEEGREELHRFGFGMRVEGKRETKGREDAKYIGGGGGLGNTFWPIGSGIRCWLGFQFASAR